MSVYLRIDLMRGVLFVALLSVCLSTVYTGEPEAACTTCIKVNTTCYNVSRLFELQAPFRNRIVIPKMGILRSKNTLFYSFEPVITSEEYYQVGFVNLDNVETNGVLSAGKMIFNFGTFDFNQDNGSVYLGGSDGIYVLETSNNRLVPYSSQGDTILSIFYKGLVYFVRDGENKIVRKKGDYFFDFLEAEIVKNFVFDRNDVTIYLCTSGLYAHKNGERVNLSKNAFFRGLAVDLDGTVYAWWIDGIYKVIIENPLSKSRIEKVAHIPTIGAMTFDNQNRILFTSDKVLFRLTETTTKVC